MIDNDYILDKIDLTNDYRLKKNDNNQEENIPLSLCNQDNKNLTNENINYQPSDFNLDQIDYVLVYSKIQAEKNENLKKYLHNLKVNGLVLEQRENDDDKLTFILIKIPFEKCLEVAEKIKFKLPIARNDLKHEAGLADSFWNKFESLQSTEVRCEKKREFFMASYSSSLRYKFEKFFQKDENKTISTKDRCILANEILSRTTYSKYLTQSCVFSGSDNDIRIGIKRLIADGTFLAGYPLHEDFGIIDGKKTDRQLLWEYWAKPKNWRVYQPIHLIRQYFGEKLAFYFSWLGFYTTWLILPSIVGIIVFAYGIITVAYDKPTNEICNKTLSGDLKMCLPCDSNSTCQIESLHESCFYAKISYMVDNPLTVVFSVFMAVWTVLFIEFWKREQSKLQFEWDCLDFEKNSETIRPQFETRVSTRRRNPITGQYEPYVVFRKRFLKYTISFSVVLLMICLVIALVIGVIVYRVSLMMVFRDEDPTVYSLLTSISAACINLTIIIILSRFYSWLAVKLTDMEYHKTDTKYENSLTIKMYLFQFVNFYASVFYIAFFKGRKLFSRQNTLYAFEEECNQSGCLSELCIQLAIIMVGKQILNNIQEVLWPLMQNYWNRKNTSKYLKKKTRWKTDYNLLGWDSLTLFDEYLEMVIQYGFITLFVVAFPLGPFFALLNNIVEIRIDAFKILTQLKRPVPKKSQDIGIWLPILNTISKLGVITNGLIIAFTSEFIPRLVYRFSVNKANHSLEGYVNFTLSKNVTFIYNQTVECYYRDFREPYNSNDSFEFTKLYYYVLVARLAFLVCFEHVVFFIVTIMHWIPDIPKNIQNQIERENILTQKFLWESKPENNNLNESLTEKCSIKTEKEFKNTRLSLKSNSIDQPIRKSFQINNIDEISKSSSSSSQNNFHNDSTFMVKENDFIMKTTKSRQTF